MIEREITPCLVKLFEQYPFVTVTGPRQSGKTTLCRAAFPHLKYVNLEAPNQREFAESDPRGFLSQLGGGAILDEIQRVPEMLSYLQVLADEEGRSSLFVLTGSEQFRLSDAISQSLAGRTALLRLLPFSLAERRRTGASGRVDDILYSGCYPRIYDQKLEPRQALGDYFGTYVERDVRQVGEIRNLSSFRRFVRLCAGRVGQLANLSSLGSDAGVSHTTAHHRHLRPPLRPSLPRRSRTHLHLTASSTTHATANLRALPRLPKKAERGCRCISGQQRY